jgi:hypothetical protein
MTHESLSALDDLWGPEFGTSQPESPLLSLLTKQAEALTRRTEGRVVGRAESSVDPREGRTWITLYAEVPALDGYRHVILRIHYPIAQPPADPTPVGVHAIGEREREIRSMNELIEWLSATLSSSKVHQVIENLQHYSRESVA